MPPPNITIRLLSQPSEIRAAEALQRTVWGAGHEVPYHLLVASIHHGGLVIGAFLDAELAGFAFGFPALTVGPAGPEFTHHSHLLAVLPEYRDSGIGFALKRAQWQMVRQQGLERITWTFDPLQSRNANLNLARLGAVCNTYLPDYYGEMTDEINAGVPSDRFQIDLWVNTHRVLNKMGDTPRRRMELGDYFSGGAEILNPTKLDANGLARPPQETWTLEGVAASVGATPPLPGGTPPFYLVEIPSDFARYKTTDAALALHWRMHTRQLFTDLFARGYLTTDFVYMRGESPRSFYVLTDGKRQLGVF